MKRKIFLLLLFLLTWGILLGQALGEIRVWVDGKEVKFDVPPQIRGGWVFVPLRGVFEAMGAQIYYSHTTRTVTAIKGTKRVHLQIGGNIAQVDGQSVVLFITPFEERGRTLVPLRFLSESLGCEVEWHPPTRRVNIYTARKSEFEMFK